MKKNKDNYTSISVKISTTNKLKFEKKVRFKSDGVKMYFNSQHIFCEISPKIRCFYIFLCEKMDVKNRVYIDHHLKQEFLDYISNITSNTKYFKLTNFDSAIKKLKELGLLIFDTTKSNYIINPKYAFRGNETARKNLLQNILNDRVNKKQPLTGLIDTTEAEFYDLNP